MVYYSLSCSHFLRRIFTRVLIVHGTNPTARHNVPLIPSLHVYLIGPSGAGKSTFLSLISPDFMEYLPEYSDDDKKAYRINYFNLSSNTVFNVVVWDFKGGESLDELENIHEMEVERRKIFLLFLDVSNRNAFEHACKRISKIKSAVKLIPTFLVVNKIDLDSQIPRKEIERFALEHDIHQTVFVSSRLRYEAKAILADFIKRGSNAGINPRAGIKLASHVHLHPPKYLQSKADGRENLAQTEEMQGVFDDIIISLDDFSRVPPPPPPPPSPAFHDIPLFNDVPASEDQEVFFPLPNSFSSLRMEMFRELERLRNILNDERYNMEMELELISVGERVVLDRFLDFFSTCPVCLEKNHVQYLLKFYFSNAPDKIHLKNNLLRLMEEFDIKEDLSSAKLHFGIPCCECFRKIFGEPP